MWVVKRLRENQDFELTILLLKYAGLWPLDADAKKTHLDKLREAGIVLTLVIGVLASTIIFPVGAFMSSSDVTAFIKGLIGVCFELLTVAKVGCLYFQMDKFKELTISMTASRQRDMADHPSLEKKKIIANNQMWINGFVVMTVLAILQFNFGFWAMVPSLFSERKHFVSIWLPIDPYTSPTYEIVFALFVIVIVISIVGNACAGGLLSATLVHLVGQFRLLNHDLERIVEDAVEDVRRQREKAKKLEVQKQTGGGGQGTLSVQTLENKDVELNSIKVEDKDVAEEMDRILEGCVYRLQECVECVRKIERSFAPLPATQIFVSVVSLLAAIFLADIDPTAFDNSMNAVDKEKLRDGHQLIVMVLMGIAGVTFLELGLCCYLSDLITEESELVRDAVYACDWLASTEGFKKSMRIVMARANQPVFVRAAGFVPLTHETFLGIANLAYSYYNTLTATVKGRTSF